MFKGDNTVVFTDTSDRAQVTLGLDANRTVVNNNAGDDDIPTAEEGDSMSITFTTASGATTTTELRVPTTLPSSNSVRL